MKPGSGTISTTIVQTVPAIVESDLHPGATLALAQALGTSWGIDDANQAMSLFLGSCHMEGQDVYASAVQLSIDLGDVVDGLGKRYFDDVDADRKKWVETFMEALQTFIDNPANAAQSDDSPAAADQASAAADGVDPASSQTPPSNGKKAGKKGPVLADLFPDLNPEGTNMAFAYKASADGKASMRPTGACPFSLADSASKETYRQWRIAVESFCDSCSQLGNLEASVRTAIVAALGPQLQSAITVLFAGNLKATSVKDVIHFLDRRHAFLSDSEERRTLEDFRNFSKTSNMSLQAYLMSWKSILSCRRFRTNM